MKLLHVANSFEPTAKRPTKDEAFAALVAIIAEQPEDAYTLYEPLGVLYRHFLPTPPKRPATATQWLAMALDAKEPRVYLRFMYSDGVDVCATDGYRMHIAWGLAWPAGFYDSQGVAITDAPGTFPEWRRLLTGDFKPLPEADFATALKGNLPKRVAPVSIIQGATHCFEYAFVRDAVSIMQGELTYSVRDESRAQTLRINAGSFTAVIMGIDRRVDLTI